MPPRLVPMPTHAPNVAEARTEVLEAIDRDRLGLKPRKFTNATWRSSAKFTREFADGLNSTAVGLLATTSADHAATAKAVLYTNRRTFGNHNRAIAFDKPESSGGWNASTQLPPLRRRPAGLVASDRTLQRLARRSLVASARGAAGGDDAQAQEARKPGSARTSLVQRYQADVDAMRESKRALRERPAALAAVFGQEVAQRLLAMERVDAPITGAQSRRLLATSADYALVEALE